MQRLINLLILLLISGQTQAAGDDKFVMVAIGDSITKAFNSGAYFMPRPKNSWSAGSSSKVKSHAWRLEDYLGIEVEAHNFAVSGSKIEDMASQIKQAIAVKPSYLTLLIGANDVCGWQDDYKDELFAFESELTRQLELLITALPEIRILLVSIPDIYQLWELGSQNGCQGSWNFTGFCKAMLGKNRTEEDRLLVYEKWQRTNDTLKYISELFAENIRFSESAMNYQFQISEISRADCFHPSVAGQESLAKHTWEDSWFTE